MSYTMRWIYEHRIIYVRLYETLTTEELALYGKDLAALLNAAPEPPVHILLDDTDLKQFPRHVTDFRPIMGLMRHPKIGWLVAYGNPNPLAHYVSQIVSKVARLRYKRVDSKREALKFLAHITNLDYTTLMSAAR